MEGMDMKMIIVCICTLVIILLIVLLALYKTEKVGESFANHFSAKGKINIPSYTIYEGRRDSRPDEYEIKGGGLKSHNECQQACSNDSLCREYMYYQYGNTIDGQNCWLKSPPKDRSQTLSKVWQDDNFMLLGVKGTIGSRS
jgi:hypothetical protein